jgi:hypothetical protein
MFTGSAAARGVVSAIEVPARNRAVMKLRMHRMMMYSSVESGVRMGP